MQNLPSAAIYNEEIKFMPWGILIAQIEELIAGSVPHNGEVLDLLCGTGNLLGRLYTHRPDVVYTGVDLENEYIEFARRSYPQLNFEVGDVLEWSNGKSYDVVVVTGGLHHLPYDRQASFVLKVSGLLKQGGFAIIADPYIDNYLDESESESERKLAAAKLGYEYLIATINNGAPDGVVEATAGLITNDVLGVEFKTAVAKIRPIFETYFSSIEEHKTWPQSDTEYGDYYFVLRK